MFSHKFNSIMANIIAIEGTAFVNQEKESNKRFIFTPNTEKPGRVQAFRRNGKVTMLSDGSVEFVEVHKKKSESKILIKLRHGKLSLTKDGAVQLTLKSFLKNREHVAAAFSADFAEAMPVIVELQKQIEDAAK